MALFVYLSTTLAALNPGDARTPLFSGGVSVECCQNILVLFDGTSVKVLINQRGIEGEGVLLFAFEFAGAAFFFKKRMSNNIRP